MTGPATSNTMSVRWAGASTGSPIGSGWVSGIPSCATIRPTPPPILTRNVLAVAALISLSLTRSPRRTVSREKNARP